MADFEMYHPADEWKRDCPACGAAPGEKHKQVDKEDQTISCPLDFCENCGAYERMDQKYGGKCLSCGKPFRAEPGTWEGVTKLEKAAAFYRIYTADGFNLNENRTSAECRWDKDQQEFIRQEIPHPPQRKLKKEPDNNEAPGHGILGLIMEMAQEAQDTGKDVKILIYLHGSPFEIYHPGKISVTVKDNCLVIKKTVDDKLIETDIIPADKIQMVKKIETKTSGE